MVVLSGLILEWMESSGYGEKDEFVWITKIQWLWIGFRDIRNFIT